MDTLADPDIFFDEKGISNYYYQYIERAKMRLFNTEKDRPKLDEIIKKIKAQGKDKDYDCIIGVSGGIDSTYVAYLVKKLGLRPLAVHFDNGWNSELAVKNIEQVLNKLDIDLHTFVINWEEFKSLQYAFLKASTPDSEIPTDHAISALLFQIANRYGVKYIVNGYNFSTESIMPVTWSYGHIDWTYIKKINDRFGIRKLKDYPNITPLKYFYYTFIRGIRILSLLNYFPYNKAEAMNILQEELGWKYYGGKHYESIYTRFFQGYILPEKFHIDKRRAHLSNLISSNQITREEALQELSKPIYPASLLKEDKRFVIKKFGITEAEFDSLMKMPAKTFRDYPNQYKFIQFLKRRLNYLRGKGLLYS
jgi:N-acetyl sugar amidotransferase